MAITISRATYDHLLALAAATPAEEVCGLLFGPGERIDRAEAAANVAADRATAFEIDPAALILAARAERTGGPRVAGYFHSHPTANPAPSARDAASAAPGSLWLIVAGGAVAAWRFDEGFQSVPLLIA